jgi:hypothetical protein
MVFLAFFIVMEIGVNQKMSAIFPFGFKCAYQCGIGASELGLKNQYYSELRTCIGLPAGSSRPW